MSPRCFWPLLAIGVANAVVVMVTLDVVLGLELAGVLIASAFLLRFAHSNS